MAGESRREMVYRGLIEIVGEARTYLRRILIVFILGLGGTVLFLRWVGFGAMQNQAISQIDACTAKISSYHGSTMAVHFPELYQSNYVCPVDIVYAHPAEVILLQAKIGIIAGIILTIPLFIYYGRKPLKRRGIWPDVKKGKRLRYVGFFAVASVFFFIIGVSYSYFVMIPFFIDFVVTDIAVPQGIGVKFRISSFVNFIILYSLIFGLAAELPLIMISTVKTRVVSYQFYRNKWRHFIIVAAIFSAVATSPDPITQLIVLGPLVFIYGIGLLLVRIFAFREIRDYEKMADDLEKEREESGSMLGSVTPDLGLGDDESESGGLSADTTDVDSEKAAEARERAEVESSNGSEGPTAIQNVDDERDLMERGVADIATSVIQAVKSKGLRIGIAFLLSTSLAFYWLMSVGGLETIIGVTLERVPGELRNDISTVTLRPFEVVFLIVKLSLFAGIAVVLPMIIYYVRDVLKQEGIIGGEGSNFYYISRVLVIIALFLIGASIAYVGMIPILVGALTNSMVESDIIASYTITEYINFIILVSVVFGVMAQMPAVMYVLVSSKVAKFETLRAKWPHFTVGVFVLAAVVTSPEPFTMFILATPLSGFYLVSLGLTRVLCHNTIKKVREEGRMYGIAEDGGQKK